jgi:hypothetical protein
MLYLLIFVTGTRMRPAQLETLSHVTLDHNARRLVLVEADAATGRERLAVRELRHGDVRGALVEEPAASRADPHAHDRAVRRELVRGVATHPIEEAHKLAVAIDGLALLPAGRNASRYSLLPFFFKGGGGRLVVIDVPGFRSSPSIVFTAIC